MLVKLSRWSDLGVSQDGSFQSARASDSALREARMLQLLQGTDAPASVQRLREVGCDADCHVCVDSHFCQCKKLRCRYHPGLNLILHVFLLAQWLVTSNPATCNLLEYVVVRGAVPEPQAMKWFSQLLEAVAHCHSRRVVHLDIRFVLYWNLLLWCE